MPPFTTNMMKRLGIAPIADTLMKVPVREKGEGMPSTNVYHENAVHQADLLFLPHDKVGRKTYKYVLLVVVDLLCWFFFSSFLRPGPANVHNILIYWCSVMKSTVLL